MQTGAIAEGPVTAYGHHIDGVAQPAGRETFAATNPATGAEWGRFTRGTAADVDQAVTAAGHAFEREWRSLSPTRRGRLLMRWADLLIDHAERIGTIETEQNGKLLRETIGQARAMPDWLYYYGGLADKVEGTVVPLEKSSILNYTLREPLGVIGVITPWNSPSMLTLMAAAPALAAGNTVVIKPSEVTSASVLALARLADQAGIPRGVVNVVTGLREVGEALVDHPGVAKIAFTGSMQAGRAVAERAGRRGADVTLELGGKSASIVFADADLDQAEAGILGGIFGAAGQTCVAGSRVYIQRSIYDALVERLARRAAAIRLGDPKRDATQMGPIATRAQLEKNERMVADAVRAGGEVLYGGARKVVDGLPRGLFFDPTIVHRVTAENPLIHEEVFGPVLAVAPFDDEDEVVALANGSQFGLAAGIWTLDIRRAHRVASRMQTGTVWVNMYRALAFNSPFGGRKQSGVGVQNGVEAIYQYLQTKSVWCELSPDYQDSFPLPS